jgi:anti-sigma regulatory factor (Ser/Thr protein kinase)
LNAPDFPCACFACAQNHAMHRGSITIACKNDPAETERLQQKICRFCELHEIPSRAIHALDLALDELLTNILHYAYSDKATHEITVRVEAEPELLNAWIEDDGKAFNPLEISPVDITRPLAEREVGGLGIHLVRSLMNRIDYERANGKNVLTLQKMLTRNK